MQAQGGAVRVDAGGADKHAAGAKPHRLGAHHAHMTIDAGPGVITRGRLHFVIGAHRQHIDLTLAELEIW